MTAPDALLTAAIRRLETVLSIGIVKDLQMQLDEANTALVASQQIEVDLTEEIDCLTGQIAKVPIWPVHQTRLIYIEFGDQRFDAAGWNRGKREVIAALIAQGFTVDAITACMNGIIEGDAKRKNYRFYPEMGLSIKNENPTEIYLGLKRAAARFVGGRLKVVVDSMDKPPRQSGKAGGKFSRGSVFPGDRITLETRPLDIGVAPMEMETEMPILPAGVLLPAPSQHPLQ